MANNDLKIGVCGLVCSKCQDFISGKCKGCSPDTPENICPLPKCAQEKGVALCFGCVEFPCQKNYDGGPIVHPLLDHWKGKKHSE